MKDGLKQKLNDWLKNEQGRPISIDAIERQVKMWGYKISNYERRLRPSESPSVEKIMKNGAIVGYKWRMENINQKEFCCLENWHGQQHNPKCYKLKVASLPTPQGRN